jgi:hypothetical protein
MSQIIPFFEGHVKHPSGRTFDQILALDDDALERSHDVVQWIFPLPERSRAQPSAPVLTPEELAEFRASPPLQLQVRRAAHVMAGFYAFTDPWRRPRDHNHLRITRIIRCLTLVNQNVHARRFHDFAVANAPNVPDSVRWFWSEALLDEPAWLVRE